VEDTYQFASAINPLAFATLVAMCLVILFANGRNAIKSLLFASAVIPLGQQFIVGGIHLHFFRILILTGIGRLMLRGEFRMLQWNIVDKLTIWWGAAAVVCSLIRGLNAETIGFVFAAWGTYFLVRCLCKGPEDFLEHLRFLGLLMFGIALCMCVESATERNPFAIFGGVNVTPVLREGRVRCQGPFRIFLLAGAFSATIFPLMVGLWLQGRRHRIHASLGIVGSLLGIYLCNSSGPLMCFFSAIVGFALWPMRHRMQILRRLSVALIIALALVMKAPVWFLISKLGDLFSGSSWHRSYLIDQFIRHFTQWFLIGTDYTANWAPAEEVLALDPNNMDITNNYVMQGIRGGIWQFMLFLAIIVFSYKIMGRLVHGSPDGVLAPKMLWAIGVALTAHCVAFIDISYFDQIAVFWYWLVAIISSFSTDGSFGLSPGPQDGRLEQSFAEATAEAAPAEPPLPANLAFPRSS
jgi:hypothetical protein